MSTITAMTPDDCPALATFHCTHMARGWSTQSWRELLLAGAQGWIIHSASEIIATLLTRQAVDEVEILTILTHPTARRQGLARQLLIHAMTPQQHIWFLEVQEDNLAAIALYQLQGFRTIATRPNYYPQSDGTARHALIMRADNSPSLVIK